MNSCPKLSRAPIVEGLIDIQVERSPVVTVDLLRRVADEFAAEFPSRQDRHMWTGQIKISPAADPIVSTDVSQPDGVILRSLDEKWVVQFRLDGFTVSRLHPYVSWEELRTQATTMWTRYVEATQPAKAIRVATRFINRIPLPAGEAFESTFLTTFSIAPDLPQAVAEFLLRLVIPFESEKAAAIVTQKLDGGPSECIFDIDVFAASRDGFSQEQVWAKLDDLREIKNRLFFGSLAPEAIERFR